MRILVIILFSLFSCASYAQKARMTVDDMNREAMDERILDRMNASREERQDMRAVLDWQRLERVNASDKELQDVFGDAMVVRIQELNGGHILPAIRVWRELHLDSPANKALCFIENSNGEMYTMTDILFQHLLNGQLNAFYEPGERAMVPRERIQRYKNITDTTTAYRINKLLVLENWLYDRNVNRMRCFILAIAPSYSLNETTDKPLFWVYYRQLIESKEFTKSKLYIAGRNEKDYPTSLKEYFDGRFFQSKILKILD